MPQLTASTAIDPVLLDDAVEYLARTAGWLGRGQALSRAYAREHDDQEPFVRAVYTSPGYRRPVAVASIHRTPPAHDHHDTLSSFGSMWLTLDRFGEDPGLPTLVDIMRRYPGAEVLRYRPGTRCTLKLGDNFVKVFPDTSGAAIDADARELFQAMLGGELDFTVAEPRGWFPSTLTQWQGRVRGLPVRDMLMSPGGPALARRLGEALASLTVSSVEPRQTTDAGWQLERTATYLHRLARLLPSLSDQATTLLDRLANAQHELRASTRLRPLHGSPHPHQWLADGRSVGLVDFDRLAWGDPELDVATFTTEVELERRMDSVAVNQAFVAGFESVAGSLRPEVLALYETHKRIALAATAATTIKPNAADKAALRLRRAFERFTVPTVSGASSTSNTSKASSPTAAA